MKYRYILCRLYLTTPFAPTDLSSPHPSLLFVLSRQGPTTPPHECGSATSRSPRRRRRHRAGQEAALTQDRASVCCASCVEPRSGVRRESCSTRFVGSWLTSDGRLVDLPRASTAHEDRGRSGQPRHVAHGSRAGLHSSVRRPSVERGGGGGTARPPGEPDASLWGRRPTAMAQRAMITLLRRWSPGCGPARSVVERASRCRSRRRGSCLSPSSPARLPGRAQQPVDSASSATLSRGLRTANRGAERPCREDCHRQHPACFVAPCAGRAPAPLATAAALQRALVRRDTRISQDAVQLVVATGGHRPTDSGPMAFDLKGTPEPVSHPVPSVSSGTSSCRPRRLSTAPLSRWALTLGAAYLTSSPRRPRAVPAGALRPSRAVSQPRGRSPSGRLDTRLDNRRPRPRGLLAISSFNDIARALQPASSAMRASRPTSATSCVPAD